MLQIAGVRTDACFVNLWASTIKTEVGIEKEKELETRSLWESERCNQCDWQSGFKEKLHNFSGPSMRPSEIHCKEQIMKSYLSKWAILYVQTFSSLKQHMSSIWKTTDPRRWTGQQQQTRGTQTRGGGRMVCSWILAGGSITFNWSLI